MKSDQPIGINSSRQRPDCSAVSFSSSTSASCEDRCCYHAKGRFQWHHLIIIAVIAGLIPSSLFFGFLYATQLPPCDCRFVAKQVERLLREQFPSSFNDLSSARDLPSVHDLASADDITSSVRHLTSSADIRCPFTRRRVRRQNGKQTRNKQQRSTGKPSTASNKKCTSKNSCNTAAGIHLEFSIPILDKQMTDRLQRINGSTESVEYGEISQNGFKPYGDRHNGTRYSFRNWTPAKWFNSSSVFKFHSNRGTIQILQSGLYYVYSQIRFYHTRPCSYAVMVNDNTTLFKCIDGTAGEPLWQFSNCHLGGVTALKADDRLWLKDMYGEHSRLYDYYVHLDPALGASSFWGAIHLGQI